MELNPQRVRNAEFKTAKRGLDPEEVRRFLGEVADQLELAQNQSTAMEARARAAVARLQELSDGASTQAAASAPDDVTAASAEQAETISRTLLLAQRTADTTIAEADAERQRLVQAATDEAASTLDSTREMSARLMDEAREEARRVGETERFAIASEVDSLKARRDFLESDVEHLEQFLAAQRARLRAAADAMVELTDRVTDGLGEVRRPLLSAADDEEGRAPVAPADDEEGRAPVAPADAAVSADVAGAAGIGDDAGDPGGSVAVDDIGGAGDLGDIGDVGGAGDLGDVGDAGDLGGAGDVGAAGDLAAAADAVVVDGSSAAEVDPPAGVGEFPAEDAEIGLLDPTPPSFAAGHDTGGHERPEEEGEIRFSFDDRR